MSLSSKRTSPMTGVPSEDRNGKAADHPPSKTKSASASAARKNGGGSLANGSIAESDLTSASSMRERIPSIEQRKQGAATSSKSAKSRAEALLSRKVTGSATSVRTQPVVTSKPPTSKGPRRSTSSDKMHTGPENGISGLTQDQGASRTGGTLPKREVSSASSCSSSEGDDKVHKVTSQKQPPKRSSLAEENGKKVWGGGPGSKSSSASKSKTPPSVRRKSSPPSSENNSRFQRQSSLRSSRNGSSQAQGRKPSSRTPSNSSLDSGLSPTKLAENESRKLRNGATKSSSEDSISDTERKTKSALSRTPSTKRKVCMEIVLEKKVISKSSGTTVVKTESGMGKSPSKHSLSSPTDENATRTSPTKSKSATTLKPSILGIHTGARMKVRTASSDTNQKLNGTSMDRSRGVSAPVVRRADHNLPGVSPYAPVRAKSGTVRSSDPKPNLKSPDRSRVMSKVIMPQRSRTRARSMEPVGRSAPVPMTLVDSSSNPEPVPAPENTTNNTNPIIHARRSQSVERKSNKDSFVASRRQAWEDKASQSPAKKGLVSPEKKFQRSGVGRRSLIDERKAMLFGGFSSARGQVKDSEAAKKPAIPAKPEAITSKPPLSRGDRKASIELHISEELPSAKTVSSVANPPVDTVKPAVLQENTQKIQPNAINMLPNKLQSSTDEVDSTRRYSPSKENAIINVANDKIYSQKTSMVDNQEYGDALEKWSMLKENQTIGGLDKKRDDISLDNKEAESRRQALLEYSNRELETSNYKKQIIEPDPMQDCPPEVKDGHYYQRIVNEEQARIESLCTLANKDSEKELSEEAGGKLRASIGKASLLTNKKFKQFRGLCEQNINPVEGEALSVTNLDLTGFWDMVLLQVDDVNSMFAEIEELRQNGWRTPKQLPQKIKTTGKKPGLTSPPPSPGIYKSTAHPLHPVDPKAKAEREKKAVKARQAREEARRRLMAAKKAAARKRVMSEDGEPPVPVEIFTPDKS
ncbi:disks large-associated protein 1-like [Patiria miniata]|uniref:Uncharacterized protein n=1 Tax=Patiria miniata TaxID=46514 RepID=A0A913Z6I7_PATMI|nr:disks large-associated protein 1-like [Patiria miniata]XP_038046627.1 disks large-associated protein 1-like [Patiria miniata]